MSFQHFKKGMISVLLIFSSGFASSQEIIYFNDDKYEATRGYWFNVSAEMVMMEGVSLRVAKKNNKSVYLWIESDENYKGNFNGTSYLFLENGERIKCIDRGIKDRVNNESRILYRLTSSEIDMLKNNRIEKIRFSIGRAKKTYTATQGSSDLYKFEKKMGGQKNELTSDAGKVSREELKQPAELKESVKLLFDGYFFNEIVKCDVTKFDKTKERSVLMGSRLGKLKKNEVKISSYPNNLSITELKKTAKANTKRLNICGKVNSDCFKNYVEEKYGTSPDEKERVLKVENCYRIKYKITENSIEVSSKDKIN